jgi:hypothetical protein
VPVRIGPVRTAPKGTSHTLAPPPAASRDELHALLHAGAQEEEERSEPTPALAVSIDDLIGKIAVEPDAPNVPPSADDVCPREDDSNAVIGQILADMAAEEQSTFQPPARLFQDFTLRCRMQRISASHIDTVQFRRRFAFAVAGIADPEREPWPGVLAVARDLSEDLLAPFLAIVRAGLTEAPCPEDAELARIYGTNSPGRIRRLLDHFERSGLIVVRTDFSGRRSVAIPELGLTTALIDA